MLGADVHGNEEGADMQVLRTAGVAAIAAAALALTAGPAVAANDSPYSPSTSTRAGFCSHTDWWRVGNSFQGYANNGMYGGWYLTKIVDDPHQTTFTGRFGDGHGTVVTTWWNCR